MDELIDLLQASLAQDGESLPDEVRALRRALSGRPRGHDGVMLAARFEGARLCVMTARPSHVGAIRAELGRSAGLIVDRWDRGLVCLVPALPREVATATRGRLWRTVARGHRASPTTAVGVSSPLRHIADAPRGLDEATRAVALAGTGSTVLADDRWFDIAVSRLRDCMQDSLAVDGPLTGLDEGGKQGL